MGLDAHHRLVPSSIVRAVAGVLLDRSLSVSQLTFSGMQIAEQTLAVLPCHNRMCTLFFLVWTRLLFVALVLPL